MKKNKFLLLATAAMSLLFVTCKERETILPKKSKDKTITKVALNISPKVTATVDGITKKITATVPFGTDLTAVTLAITHSGASIFPLPKTAQDFSNGKSVTYIVKAKDDSTQIYTVSISVAEKGKSDKNTITEVRVNTSPKVTATIDDATKRITATVPFGTDLTAVTLAITHSGASIAPLLSEAQDFSNGKEVTYTVKAEDGTTQEYKVSISVAEKELSNTKTITRALIINPPTEMNISGTKITATVPFGTDLTAITISIEHNGASIAPLSSEAQDFSNGKEVTYTVKAEDGTTQEYTISCRSIDNTFSANVFGWMDEVNSNITISLINPNSADTYKLYISNNENCNLQEYQNCTNGQLVNISGNSETFVSKAMRITSKNRTYFKLKDNKNTYSKIKITNQFPPREEHQVIVFNNKMLLIGGRVAIVDYRNDVYSSSNGAIWIQETSKAAFPSREGHQVVVFKNKLYLIGGKTSQFAYTNDVYSSSDGKNWTLETANAAFPARSGHQVVVFDNKMFLIGGYSGTRNSGASKKDVYSSIDGKTWNLETATPSFSARQSHQVVVFKNKMFLIGGYDENSASKNDVYSSIDGKVWTLGKANASFSARFGHQVVVFKNKMFLIGGYDDNLDSKNDVYSSIDGKVWNLETAAPSFSARSGHHVVVFNNKMYLTGGANSSPLRKKDVWRSGDGINWKEAFGFTITK